MGVHDGHRQRLLQRFLEEGLENFASHNKLELLLFYAIPRRDTNEIAHRLLNTFGSFSAVLDAPIEDLERVEGIGHASAAYLKLMGEIARAYYVDRQTDIILDSTQKAGAYLMPRFLGRTQEVVYQVCLDQKCRVLNIALMHEGSVHSTEVNLRKIVGNALKYNATGVILAHNHPGGVALPSPEDLATTRQLKDTLRPMGINLIDHIIVADRDFVSLADSGIL
jgi:DNA repair protein RadC